MIKIDQNLCKGCDICTEFCRKNVYEPSKTLNRKGVYLPVPVNIEECKKCNLCAILCPDLAITVEEDHE